METKTLQIVQSYMKDEVPTFVIEEVGGGAWAWRTTIACPIDNRVPAIREAAMHQLGALCHATRRAWITDTKQLHGIPFIAQIDGYKIVAVDPMPLPAPTLRDRIADTIAEAYYRINYVRFSGVDLFACAMCAALIAFGVTFLAMHG